MGGELLLWVVGLLLGGLLRVARVGLSGRRGSWVAARSRSHLVGNVGHVVLAVRVGVVAHGELVVPAQRTQTSDVRQKTSGTEWRVLICF